MLWVATFKVVVATVAMPLEFKAADPICVLPSMNETVPVGMIPAVEVTVAVNWTDWLSVEGFVDDTSVVLVFSCCTSWLKALDALAAKFPLPA